jgi:hypothetical protein
VLAAKKLAEKFGLNTIRKGSTVALNATDEAFLAGHEQAVVSCYKSGNTVHIQIAWISNHMGARMSSSPFDVLQARIGSWMALVEDIYLLLFLT